MMKVISFTIAIALALCFAVLSAAYWITELAGQTWMPLAVAISVCVSLMTPICAYHMRSHGFVLIVAVAVFFGCDTYQNTKGYETLQSLTVSDEVKAAQARVATAQQALDDLPTPNATGEIRQASTWETVNTALTDRLEGAEARLDALQAPDTPPLYVAAVMGLIQIALSIFFACLGQPKKTRDPAREIENASNVVRFSHRAKPMNEKDLKAWNAISKTV